MRVNLVYDLSQYRLVLDPLRDELAKRGHSFKGKNKQDYDCSVMIQAPGPVGGRKHPRFFIQHGLSCTKGWGNNQPIEYYMTPAPYWAWELRRRMIKKGYQKIFHLELTGWPRMDSWHRMIQRRDQVCAMIRERHKLDDRPIVVYFPTYAGGGHSTRPVTIDQVYHELSQYYHVFVGPHQMEHGSREAEYKTGLSDDLRSASEKKRVLLYENPYLPRGDEEEFYLGHVPIHLKTPEGKKVLESQGKNVLGVWDRLAYLVAADAFVGDISGMVFEFLSTDKPIILIDKPEDPNYFKLNHNEYGQVFDPGPKTPFDGLVETINQQLSQPHEYQLRRKYWLDYVVGPVDGKCAERVADFMEAHVPCE